jgi:hypothetical protein
MIRNEQSDLLCHQDQCNECEQPDDDGMCRTMRVIRSVIVIWSPSCSRHWHLVVPSLRPMSGEFPNCLTRTTGCWFRPGSPSDLERRWRLLYRALGAPNTSEALSPACRGVISVQDVTVSCIRRCFTHRRHSLVRSAVHFSRKGTMRGVAADCMMLHVTITRLHVEAVCATRAYTVFGFDHRIGHFRLPDMVDMIPKPPVLHGIGVSTWDVVG